MSTDLHGIVYYDISPVVLNCDTIPSRFYVDMEKQLSVNTAMNMRSASVPMHRIPGGGGVWGPLVVVTGTVFDGWC